MKLEHEHKHILKLIARDIGDDGWTKVSEVLYRPISKGIPTELAEFEKLDDGGRVRLTVQGQSVLDAMEWL